MAKIARNKETFSPIERPKPAQEADPRDIPVNIRFKRKELAALEHIRESRGFATRTAVVRSLIGWAIENDPEVQEILRSLPRAVREGRGDKAPSED